MQHEANQCNNLREMQMTLVSPLHLLSACKRMADGCRALPATIDKGTGLVLCQEHAHLGQKWSVQALHLALVSAVFWRHWWQVVPFSLS
jgi:hypothetical protein